MAYNLYTEVMLHRLPWIKVVAAHEESPDCAWFMVPKLTVRRYFEQLNNEMLQIVHVTIPLHLDHGRFCWVY
jgi:hypothetical protein